MKLFETIKNRRFFSLLYILDLFCARTSKACISSVQIHLLSDYVERIRLAQLLLTLTMIKYVIIFSKTKNIYL